MLIADRNLSATDQNIERIAPTDELKHSRIRWNIADLGDLNDGYLLSAAKHELRFQTEHVRRADVFGDLRIVPQPVFNRTDGGSISQKTPSPARVKKHYVFGRITALAIGV